MAKTKEPKAGRGKEPGPGKGGRAGKRPRTAKVKVKGRLLETTNLVVVLFGLSLLAERVVAGAVG